jgi:hypothetical protein
VSGVCSSRNTRLRPCRGSAWPRSSWVVAARSNGSACRLG